MSIFFEQSTSLTKGGADASVLAPRRTKKRVLTQRYGPLVILKQTQKVDIYGSGEIYNSNASVMQPPLSVRLARCTLPLL